MPALATVGHSTRALAEFLAVLAAHGVDAIADVRRFPGSRRQPQFGQEPLKAALAAAGVDYRWFPELGGRRRADPTDEANAGWRVAAFRAYADHLVGAEGVAGLAALAAWAGGRHAAVLCAEALWTRCHRRLIADALLARGWSVLHLLTTTRVETHRMPAHAVVGADGTVRYPAG